MVLSINEDRTLITISSTLLDDFIAAPEDYTDIDIQIYFNSLTESTTETYTDVDPITGVTNVATSAGIETINPAFLDTTEFSEGVYHILITLTSDSEIQTDEGCLFVQDTIKCNVDDYLLNEQKTMLERVLIGLKYNSLLTTNSCSCKCDQYTELYLDLYDSVVKENCGTC